MVDTGFHLDPPPGFQGLHPDKMITFYRRNLPHWRQEGASYFVTFRQNDSLPQSKLRLLQAIRIDWEQRHPYPRSDEDWTAYSREVVRHVEHWLDEGSGSCRLAQPDLRKEVVDALHYFDDDRYELGGYVVMPNHVHVVVRPLNSVEHSLENILQGWKRHTAKRINQQCRRRGVFWQEESFDRIIRDAEHLWRCLQYIGRNPRKAKLGVPQYSLWIRPEWESLGWRFEDDILYP